jgi:hypothetical protein
MQGKDKVQRKNDQFKKNTIKQNEKYICSSGKEASPATKGEMSFNEGE